MLIHSLCRKLKWNKHIVNRLVSRLVSLFKIEVVHSIIMHAFNRIFNYWVFIMQLVKSGLAARSGHCYDTYFSNHTC